MDVELVVAVAAVCVCEATLFLPVSGSSLLRAARVAIPSGRSHQHGRCVGPITSSLSSHKGVTTH